MGNDILQVRTAAFFILEKGMPFSYRLDFYKYRPTPLADLGIDPIESKFNPKNKLYDRQQDEKDQEGPG